jgi:transcription antitermination factor NusB
MINRIIIRIKVLQIVYAYYQKENNDLKAAENELIFSLGKAYDLYHYLLDFVSILTDYEQKRLDRRKHKILATDEELNPNTRFIDNRFAEQLRTNTQLEKFVYEKGRLWGDEDAHFIRTLSEKIMQSDIYAEYLSSDDSYEADREFWRRVMKNILLPAPELAESLEEKSIYWEDDLDIVGTFVLKSIKKINPQSGREEPLLPMFKDEEDKQFAIQLLHRSILEEKENTERIIKQIKNWDIDRIASMDLYILQIALSEILNFDSIPVSVTMNEYIDLARYYSTPKSPVFINGILDAIVNELKTEKILFKN